MLPLAAAPVAQAQPIEDKCPLNAATMDPAQLAELFPECVGTQDQAPEIDPDLLVDLHDQNPVQQDQQDQQEQAPVQQSSKISKISRSRLPFRTARSRTSAR